MKNKRKIYLLIIVLLLVAVPKGLQLTAQQNVFSSLSTTAQYIVAIVAIVAVLIGGTLAVLYLIKQSKV